MKSKWNEQTASEYASDKERGLRVYSSQLLGQDEDLVLHGGGNTSVKGSRTTPGRDDGGLRRVFLEDVRELVGDPKSDSRQVSNGAVVFDVWSH